MVSNMTQRHKVFDILISTDRTALEAKTDHNLKVQGWVQFISNDVLDQLILRPQKCEYRQSQNTWQIEGKGVTEIRH
jgi:hypothetical protein